MMATATMSASTCQVETVQSSERSSAILLGSNLSSPYFQPTAFQSTHNNNMDMQQLPSPGPNYQGMAMHLPMPVPPNSPQPAHTLPFPLDSATPSCNNRAIVTRQPPPPPAAQHRSKPQHVPRTCQPQLIATISAGFTKGDYLIREERGCNLYFDFFEEAYNFACQKGYTRMNKLEEEEYMDIIKRAHRSVPGGCRYNTGRLLMVLRKKLVPIRINPSEVDGESEEPLGPVMDGGNGDSCNSSTTMQGGEAENNIRKKKMDKKLARSTNTLPTDSESSAYSSSASTSFVDSWE